MRRLILAVALLGCGGGRGDVVQVGSGHDPTVIAPRGVPGVTGPRALLLAGPGVDGLELYTTWYGLVSHGWRVRVATPEGLATRGQAGLPVPTDLSLSEVDPEQFDVLFVPKGAPTLGRALELVKAFAAARHLATTGGGADVLRAAGVLEGRRLANPDRVVEVDGNLLSAHGAGDIPGLLWALQTYAEDRLRQAHVADGGHPP